MFPWPPGTLTVRRNAHGHYTLMEAGRGVATVYGSHDAAVVAAVEAVRDHAAVLARVAALEEQLAASLARAARLAGPAADAQLDRCLASLRSGGELPTDADDPADILPLPDAVGVHGGGAA